MLFRPNLQTFSAAFSLVTIAGCSALNRVESLKLAKDVPGLEPQATPGQSSLPDAALPPLVAGDNRLLISSGTYVPVRYSGGRPLIPIEGLLADSGFARLQANASLLKMSEIEKHAQLNHFLNKVVDGVGAKVSLHDTFISPDVGYFSAWVALQDYPSLKGVSGLPMDVSISPVIQSAQRPHNIALNQPAPPLANPAFADFSGIERMGVSSFMSKVKAELGQEPTGKRVSVGVTDTGVTYAHPAFRDDQSGNSRVTYMKDFTAEGAGFISPLAKISVVRIEKNQTSASSKVVAVTLNAEFLEPDALESMNNSEMSTLPFKKIEDEVFLLPEKLVKLLEQPESSVRLGVINETAFASRDEKVDINGNGKIDDSFYFFHVPALERRPQKAWIDFSGTGNFKASKALRDFNSSADVQDVMSERLGLSFTEIEVAAPTPNETALTLTRVALVGFDPGNHGSHVSGIIGAGKTLSNDSLGTLARGVSPEANLMVNRVCSNNGGCNATRAIIDLAQNGAQIINMSLGGLSADNDGYGVQETVINRLTELYNVLFVISAGNSGPGRQTVGSPSTARHALSVAATATPNMILRQYNWIGRGSPIDSNESGDADFMMYFSSRGPSAAGGFKPNISAPGTQLSIIQLNSAPGFRSGADVYWGTSMAAPAAAGAAALLLDAALAYNEKKPNQPLPTDALTLRRVLLDSARPFQVSSYNPATGEARKGIYTWIDQGYGMVSLPEAWELLKKKASVQLSSGVVVNERDLTKTNIVLDYNVRVLRTMGNAKKYDGNQSFSTGTQLGEETKERKFGQGIWLSDKESDKLVEVHFTRKLPLSALGRSDVGELLRQLNTSAESFELETVFYGSRLPWLKVGVPQSTSCDENSTPENKTLTLIGSGALENPVGPQPGPALNPLRASSLFVCLKKDAVGQLSPGDHGAIIRAYRVVDGQRDALAAFEIPVYLTMPHHSAALQAQFSQQGRVKSFMVDRHYVRVPEGVSVLRISLEVPLTSDDGKPQCSAASLMVLKGSNVAQPADLAGAAGVAANCNSLGAPISNRRVAKFSELNPAAGIWDIHVFGRFQFPLSTYKLAIDYATFSELAPLNLTPTTVSGGEFEATLKESTFDANPDAAKSVIRLNALLGRTKHEIAKDGGVVVVPSAAGVLARSYAADTGTVTITTTSVVAGLDIDILVDECDDAELKECKQVAASGNAAAEERAVFLPKTGKYYALRVDPFEVPASLALFSATEIINAPLPETGTLRISPKEGSAGSFKVEYTFDASTSGLLQEALFKSGQYEIAGDCKLANQAGMALVNLPIQVLAK